ncbi:hypothetical protein BVY02_02200 [bacterium J17]|nr:hypothetical protein BVY02_02200 [bacterium J17]
MAIVKAFKSLRPAPEQADQVACVPYDVINTEEARALAGDNPKSFLRVIRSEIEFGEGQDPYAEEIYQRAKDNLNALVESGALIEDQEQALYIYQIHMGDHVQTGVVGCSAVDDYDNDLVKIHEKTRPVKENDRTKHMVTLGAHTGPVFLAYKQQAEIDALVEKETKETPLYDVKAEDGVRHIVWKAKDSDAISVAFSKVPETYVADGHHRAKSSSRAREEMRSRNSQHSGDEDYNFFLSVLFPHNQLQILPYNRVIYKVSKSPEDILNELSAYYAVDKGASPSPERKGDVSMYLDGSWYGLRPLDDQPQGNPVEALDVSVLQEEALTPVFGIGDPRTDENIDFIGGIRGTEELVRLVDGGKAAVAFSMYPVSIEELFAVADQGLLMAPKSTWFEPKLRSGLFVHRFG